MKAERYTSCLDVQAYMSPSICSVCIACCGCICFDWLADRAGAELGKDGECDKNSFCSSGECCCHDQQYGTCYNWRCCTEGSKCDHKEMKCKSKDGSGHRIDVAAEVMVEDVLSVRKQFVAGQGMDINAIQQQ